MQAPGKQGKGDIVKRKPERAGCTGKRRMRTNLLISGPSASLQIEPLMMRLKRKGRGKGCRGPGSLSCLSR